MPVRAQLSARICIPSLSRRSHGSERVIRFFLCTSICCCIDSSKSNLAGYTQCILECYLYISADYPRAT